MNSKEKIDSVEIIKNIGIIPVINIPNPTLAEPLAKALSDGNLPLIEVTLRNDLALESIKHIKEAHPDMLVGAGTVLSCEQVQNISLLLGSILRLLRSVLILMFR
jgi:2-dehydro-3-deoxyphosphogluconate aldolase/(4S)-4-hydroxy-2-oxoglutarate aldolase